MLDLWLDSPANGGKAAKMDVFHLLAAIIFLLGQAEQTELGRATVP